MNKYSIFKKNQAIEGYNKEHNKYEFIGFVRSDKIKEKKEVRIKKYEDHDKKGNIIIKEKKECFISAKRKKIINEFIDNQINERISNLKKEHPRIRKLGQQF